MGGISKKIVLLGYPSVGKTSLIQRFVNNTFSDKYISSIGVTISKKNISFEEQNISFIIWDIEGNTQVENIRESYLFGSHGIIYVLDCDNIKTYEKLENELSYLGDKFGLENIFIVGNKGDLIDNKRKQEIENEISGITITSCKTGDNVNQVFEKIAESVL